MIASKMLEDMKNSSWIRAMFEEGERLRQIHGADKVYDFSLGNPDYEPPAKVLEELKRLVASDRGGLHRYTSNAGDPEVRTTIAARMAAESGLPCQAEHIIMTCGAAGGLNVVLKTILNPGDEVIAFSPYFVEYHFYVSNHGGKTVVVPTNADFVPTPEALEAAITHRTRAIILNSPNNPTGVVYSEEALQALAAVLESKEKEIGSPILVISDEPYVKLVYGGTKVPNMMKIFKNCVVINSFSKSLALPGERIGYIAASPQIQDVSTMIGGMIFANRTLGFVNAPSIFQHLVASSLDEGPDTNEYQQRRDLLYNHLISVGFECVKPQGAFYLFPRSPIADDVEFCQRALKYNLLMVPGVGFKCPGYVRLAYCVSMRIIENSLPAFSALAAEFF